MLLRALENVRAPEVPNAHRAKPESLNHPVVLWVPIAILVCSESMCDALERVYNGAREVICWVDLPPITEVD